MLSRRSLVSLSKQSIFSPPPGVFELMVFTCCPFMPAVSSLSHRVPGEPLRSLLRLKHLFPASQQTAHTGSQAGVASALPLAISSCHLSTETQNCHLIFCAHGACAGGGIKLPARVLQLQLGYAGASCHLEGRASSLSMQIPWITVPSNTCVLVSMYAFKAQLLFRREKHPVSNHSRSRS